METGNEKPVFTVNFYSQKLPVPVFSQSITAVSKMIFCYLNNLVFCFHFNLATPKRLNTVRESSSLIKK